MKKLMLSQIMAEVLGEEFDEQTFNENQTHYLDKFEQLVKEDELALHIATNEEVKAFNSEIENLKVRTAQKQQVGETMDKIISVYYKEIKLGELAFDGSAYIYRAGANNVQKAHKKGYSTFVYGFDEDFKMSYLPAPLKDMLPESPNDFVVEVAGINPDDSEFEMLCKIAGANAKKDDFHVELK